jgi:uncharacterized membrane protein SpoIIM required for sporulation
MREAVFLKSNNHKWKEFEELIEKKQSNPDLLANLYIELTDDLAYAQTYYPQSQTVIYLNNLISKVHNLIYRNKKEQKSRLITFWTKELPLLLAGQQKYLLYSFIIFSIAVSIGAVSAAYDDSYVRLILGDDYVNMTIDNIEKGDPMGVYKSSGQSEMFLAITVNNIKVSFLTFILGIASSFGTGYILFQNGIMLGAFQYFFHTHDLLLTSALSIWIHGTLEISAIIIAGAAGIIMGNSILFPGTYSRLDSFKHGARKGLKLIIGLVPIFIVAGFLEGFVTRHTQWPSYLKLFIIILSALFIMFYFVMYPIYLKRKHATS